MTLSCDRTFTKRTYGPGIYINEVTVANVVDISGEILPFRDQPYDIGIKLVLDIGRDFQPEMLIAGSFKRDPVTQEVVDWGSAFVVQEAIAKLGFTGRLLEGNRIPEEVLQTLIGKKFLRLSYISGMKEGGKPRYSDWNIIGKIEEGSESLAQRFRKSLAKGYPKNYRPHLLDDVSILDAEPVAVKDEDAF